MHLCRGGGFVRTVAAFRGAIRLGAQMIEFDVALTRDGYPVLMHDADATRRLFNQGVDFILSDKVETMMKVAQGMGIEPLEEQPE